MQRLLAIMRRLRAPEGCPWDREQTHLSLRSYLLEEAAEAVDAISGGDPAEITDELGDVLLQVAFHAVIAEEAGSFSYQQIENAIVDKLVRRHPHVFAGARADSADEVLQTWRALKAKEGRRTSALPSALGALQRAQQLGRKSALPPASSEEVAAALRRLEDAPSEAALGALLLALSDRARALGLDAELALRAAVRDREQTTNAQTTNAQTTNAKTPATGSQPDC